MFHLALAVEVQQRTLSSGARSWGRAVPTEILRSQLKQRRWQAKAGEAGSTSDSRDPHLAGSEQRFSSGSPEKPLKIIDWANPSRFFFETSKLTRSPGASPCKTTSSHTTGRCPRHHRGGQEMSSLDLGEPLVCQLISASAAKRWAKHLEGTTTRVESEEVRCRHS